MDSTLIAELAEGVYRREYSLLLGAGASLGAEGGNGEPLPSGPQLQEQLIAHFGIETDGQAISLQRAYAAAQRKDATKLEDFIRRQFTRCKPSWQHLLAKFQWQRIWTLNVDDVVETVLRDQGIQYDRFDWTSSFRDTSRSDYQVIHLHGFAKDTILGDAEESTLVFSMEEYTAPLADPRAWHRVFSDEFTDRPFIILGASLSEEFDLQPALSKTAAAAARGYPSVIVLNKVTRLEREELEALSLIVVEAEAHSFMSQLQVEVEKLTKRLGGHYRQIMDPQVARFLQQFIDLRYYEPTNDKNSRSFYLGFEPQWKNILDDDDAQLQTTSAAFAAIEKDIQSEEIDQQVHILTGSAGSGKSAGLLRIARSLIAHGHNVFQFRGEEALDIPATKQWLKRMPKTILIFDGCADFADSLGDLAEQCALANASLFAIGAERSTRRGFFAHKIDGEFLCMREQYQYGNLSDPDIDVLLDKLSSRRRLGKITRLNRPQQQEYFRKESSRKLFEGMADLEGGQGFRLRLKRDFEGIEDKGLRRLYAAACVAYGFGYPLRMGVAVQVSGMSATELTKLLTSEEQDLLVLSDNGIRPPHRITASLVVDAALSQDLRFEALERLTYALAPHVDIQAIRNQTRPYRLLRRLMDQETVIRLVGPDQGRKFYELLEEYCDWNGRYWEQRALFESDLENHAQARSYAEHSLTIHRHPFAFNTLGTILGRIAVQGGNPEFMREAIENLQHARDERRWETSEHPYVTYFNMMLRFGEKWGLGIVPITIRNTFNEWYDRARMSSVFVTPREERQLGDILKRWLAIPTA